MKEELLVHDFHGELVPLLFFGIAHFGVGDPRFLYSGRTWQCLLSLLKIINLIIAVYNFRSFSKKFVWEPLTLRLGFKLPSQRPSATLRSDLKI